MCQFQRHCQMINCLFSWESKSYLERIPIKDLYEKGTAEIFYELAWKFFGIPPQLQSLRLNGRIIQNPLQSIQSISSLEYFPKTLETDTNFKLDDTCQNTYHTTHWNVTVSGRLLGGKGGFGTLLRGQKGAKRKTKNFDACRDLTGRRLRHAKVMERLTKWMEKRQQDDELVAALGGDPNVPLKNITRKKENVDEVRVLSSPMEKASSSAYLEELHETLDKTSMAVEKALHEKSLLDSDASSSSSPKDSNKLSKTSQILTSRYIETMLTNYDDVDSDEDEAGSDNEGQQKNDPDHFDFLLQKISVRDKEPIHSAPVKRIVSRKNLVEGSEAQRESNLTIATVVAGTQKSMTQSNVDEELDIDL